eukprot:GAHX01001935.1.p1 GENE.GAHX01001935.1~~GAHX01001935.1.p1  ORF type:complete len:53 (+),score=9.64 GAHX01001935.1:17-175(+)
MFHTIQRSYVERAHNKRRICLLNSKSMKEHTKDKLYLFMKDFVRIKNYLIKK